MANDTVGTSPHEYGFVDLFCGAGGFTEGFLLAGAERARFRLLAASDIHRHAQATHEHRFREQLGLEYGFLRMDIRNREFSRELSKLVPKGAAVDVVCGGPPCQGFSVFGARHQDDPRNDLFDPYLRIVHALRPRYFVMENVPGLVYMYRGRAAQQIHQAVESLRQPGYTLAGPLFVNSAAFGVPQSRERVLYIGSRDDQPAIAAVSHPSGVRTPTVGEAISDLAFLGAGARADSYDPGSPPVSSYQEESRLGRFVTLRGGSGTLHNHESSRHTTKVQARYRLVPKGSSTKDVRAVLVREGIASGKKWCVRLDDAAPSFTLTTIPDDFIHYCQDRSLTVRECARLQSFDDTFVFLGPRTTGGGGAGNKMRNHDLPQYTQVGNAVPPLLARGIATTILRHLEMTSASKGGPERLPGISATPAVVV
jgi:DNA (cytosine-5)-methyltransferase 1